MISNVYADDSFVNLRGPYRSKQVLCNISAMFEIYLGLHFTFWMPASSFLEFGRHVGKEVTQEHVHRTKGYVYLHIYMSHSDP